MKFKTYIGLCAGACVALPILAFGQAQSAYPSRPVQIIVPYATGGNPDVISRILAQKLSERLGKAFVVDNRPGSGGNIGAEKLATSAPDGYTIAILDSAQTSINPALYRKLSYNPKTDFAVVAPLVAVPTVLIVNPTLPVTTLSTFIDYAKAHPTEINYGSAGNGSIHHLTAAMFSTATGVKMTHVPYKGSSQTVPAVLSGEIQASFVGIPTAKNLIETKKLRVLGISTAQRSKSAPEIPTLAEAGVPGFNVAAVIGLFAPRGTPEPIKAQLHDAVTKIMAERDVQEKLSSLGMELLSMTPTEYAKMLESDIEKYGSAVRASGMSID